MATIKIDLDRTIGRLDRRIFGGFVEHMGRCVYGGLYEPGSPLSDATGFRQDVLAAVRGLRVPVLRWPGGNFASGYHWLDGVGPVEQRPRRMNLAWNMEESNAFGTHEFVTYCRAVGAEPYICLNMGSGTLDEAQAWVEYCNGTGDTKWANLRREHGQNEPYGVKLWALGNELYGDWQIGALGADRYVEKARQFARIVKLTDPSVELVGCGKFGWTEWDRVVLEGIGSVVDYHSIHLYTGSADYYSNVLAPHQAERALEVCEQFIAKVRYQQNITHPIKIAYDEWNVWYRQPSDDNMLEERYTLADTLAVATYLNIFARHCRSVTMANLAQLVNVIAPIVTDQRGHFLQPIYHPLWLYANYLRDTVLDAHVTCDTFSFPDGGETSPWFHRVADRGPFPLLDVAATHDAATGDVTLAVVNRDRDRAHPTTIRLADRVTAREAEVFEVNASDIAASNSFEEPQRVAIVKELLTAGGDQFTHIFPAHSLTVLRLRV